MSNPFEIDVQSRKTMCPDKLPADYRIRAYDEADREELNALESNVVDWWHREGSAASLHQVAVALYANEVVGHLQARDRSVPKPSRRPGQCHFSLTVAAGHRRRGIGASLYEQVEAFAIRRHARALWTAYRESKNNPAASFLESRGFEPLERYFPSASDLRAFDPKEHWDAVERVKSGEVELTTYIYPNQGQPRPEEAAVCVGGICPIRSAVSRGGALRAHPIRRVGN